MPTFLPFAKRETKYTTKNLEEKTRAARGWSFVAAMMPSKTEAFDPRHSQGKPRTEFLPTPVDTLGYPKTPKDPEDPGLFQELHGRWVATTEELEGGENMASRYM